MNKILSVIFIISLLLQPCFGQKNLQAKIDSLLIELPKAKDDTNKVNIYAELTVSYRNIYNDYSDSLAMHYGHLGLALAQKINDKKGEAKSYHNLGRLQNDKSLEIEYYFKALKIYEEIEDKTLMADVYISIGMVYFIVENNSLALEYYLKALKLKNEIKDKEKMMVLWNQISSTYSRVGNYSAALKYQFKKLHMAEAMKDSSHIAWAYGNIGSIYKDQGNYSYGIDYFNKFLRIEENLGDTWAIPYAYQNIALLYLKQGNYALALENFFKTINLQNENKGNNAICYIRIGSIYIQQKKFKKAEEALTKGLNLAKKENHKRVLLQAYSNLSGLDSALAVSPSTPNLQRAKYAIKALEYYKLANVYRDSLSNEEINQKLIKKNIRYEFEKKEIAKQAEYDKNNSIAKAEHKKQQLIILFTCLSLLSVLLFAGYIFRLLRIRNKQNKIISEQKEQSDNLLLNILPSEIAEELKETGQAKPKSFDNISVLFTDFVGFTRISEKLSPTELVEEINHCFTVFDDIIERNGLEKIKTIGDAYMAVCGLPIENIKHAIKAVEAAKEIIAFIYKYEKEGGKFKIRIGINSGPVVAGIVGVKKFSYDIWGDTVNTAARLEQNSVSGKINISGTTFELVKNDFTCTYRGKIDAKNKGEIDMYFVE